MGMLMTGAVVALGFAAAAAISLAVWHGAYSRPVTMWLCLGGVLIGFLGLFPVGGRRSARLIAATAVLASLAVLLTWLALAYFSALKMFQNMH